MRARKDGVKARVYWRGLLAGLAAAGAAAGAAALAGGLARADLAMIFLVAVLAAGALSGLLAGLTAATAGAFAYNFLFLDPRFSLDIAHAGDALTFALFFLAALLTGWLSARAREAARRAEAHACEVDRLRAFAERLSGARTGDEVGAALAAAAQALAHGPAVVLVREGDLLAAAPADARLDDEAALHALAAAQTRRAATTSGWRLSPLGGAAGGVLATRGEPDAEGGLDALARQAGVALDRATLAQEAIEVEALRRADRLRAALLNSVSHDLRTPLTGILGSATTLLEYGDRLSLEDRRNLLAGVREEADRLGRYIGALLDLSRLEAGALEPRLEPVKLPGVAKAALQRSFPEEVTCSFELSVVGDPATVLADPALLTQLLVNVMDNAVRHGAAQSPVRVILDRDGGFARVLVEDDGPGVPAEVRARLFTPFGSSDRRGRGAGLGLSIARGFAEAMGGELRLDGPPGRGARFVLRLPLAG